MIARHFIDSLDFARRGMELRGEVAITEMPRLQDMLASTEGQVSYMLRGSQDKYGNPMLDLVLKGSCQLRCQRCLQGMTYLINNAPHLLLVPEGELDDFSPEEDEEDRIPAQTHMDVLELVEDEILLGLPLSPRHELGECNAATEYLAHSAKPFAALSKMKVK